MDWTGWSFPFSILDITNGVRQTMSSFMPFILLFMGMCIAFFGIAGLLSVFRGGSFFEPFHRD